MDPLGQLVGQSAAMLAIQAQVRRLLSAVTAARRVPPVLLRGETGTGKGLLARALHAASSRAKGRFVSVNCAAIPDTLLEAELFGFERGAFTDARQAKPGLFQEAHGGTLFLDEAGLLAESLQAKLLTAVDEQVVRRLGSTRDEPTDCWVIAATSVDLEQARRERRFREDLYHRLSVFTIHLPPLRERGADVLALADFLLARVCADYGLPSRSLDDRARVALARYGWPGNVRELANVVERAALLSETPLISADMLGLPLHDDGRETAPLTMPRDPQLPRLRESLDDLERSKLVDALEQAHWNVALAAEILGVPRNTLRYRIEKHGLMRPDAPVRRSTLRTRLSRPTATRPSSRAADQDSGRSVTRGTSAPVTELVSGPRQRAIYFLRASLAASSNSAPVVEGLRVLAEKIEAFGGRVLRYADGAVDAAFGLEPTEDAPARAGYAALAIRRVIEHVGREHPDITVRIAIDRLTCVVVETGNAPVRLAQESFDEAQRTLAALIERTHSDVVVGPGAVPYLERQFALAIAPASHDDPGSTVLVGGDALAAGTRSAAVPRRSPFVGRTHELTLLDQHLRQAVATRHGHAVGIMGGPGMGKSRLLAELRQIFASQAVAILEGQCVSHTSAYPYSLLIDLLKRAWSLEELHGSTALAAAVTQHLDALDLRECEPAISRLLGLPSDTLGSLSPAAVKERIFEALRQVVLAHGRKAPLVLFLEDLHWADETSQEFISVLVDNVPTAPILLIVTTRPGHRAAWLDRSWASQLALPPLTIADACHIARAILPAEINATVIEEVARRGEGNPFFLEELARNTDVRHAANVAVPGTIQDVLSARIDRLPPGSQRLLEAASVLGREAPRRILDGVVNDVDGLGRDVGPLLAHEFLHERRDAHGPVYVFKHVLTQEVAHSRLAPSERRRLHAAVGSEIERLHGTALDTIRPQLAHHALHAENWESAYRYLRTAATLAVGSSGFSEAALLLEQALAALLKLPTSVERATQEYETLLELWTAYFESRQYRRAVELEPRFAPLVQAQDQQSQLAAYLVRRAQFVWGQPDPGGTIALVREALRVANPADLRTRSYAHFLTGAAYRDSGAFDTAFEHFAEGARILGSVDLQHADGPILLPILVNIYAWWSEAYAVLGRHQDAATLAARASKLAHSIGNDSARVFGDGFLGYALALRGELAEAVPLLEQAFTSQAAEFATASSFAAGFLAYTLALTGDHARARELLAEHFPFPPSGLGPMQRPRYRTVTAAAHLAAGQPGDTLREVDLVIPSVRRVEARGHLPTLLRLKAEALLCLSSADFGEIRSLCDEARQIAASVGLEPEVAHSLAVLGQAEIRDGMTDAGQQHMETARTLFRTLGMEFWARRVVEDRNV